MYNSTRSDAILRGSLSFLSDVQDSTVYLLDGVVAVVVKGANIRVFARRRRRKKEGKGRLEIKRGQNFFFALRSNGIRTCETGHTTAAAAVLSFLFFTHYILVVGACT